MIRLKVLNVVGCRANVIKMASLMLAMQRSPEIEPMLLHTGQHRGDAASREFFKHLGIPAPDIELGVGADSHAKQTAALMGRMEDTLCGCNPDLVVVVGDLNSTLAASMTAVKLGIPVAHVEAGLRSFDREMPEEINRLMTDAISDLLFVTEASARHNLISEGIPSSRIHFVGNVTIDTLDANARRVEESCIVEELQLEEDGYAVLTLQRPKRIDHNTRLESIVQAIAMIQQRLPVVFPTDLRTIERLHQLGIWEQLSSLPGLRVVDPLPYLDFIALMKSSLVTLTDSGEVQEETTALQVPCLTLRSTTERPATVSEGTNTLVGHSTDLIVAEAMRILAGDRKGGRVPSMWDGQASGRIVDVLLRKREELFELYRNVRGRRLDAGIPDQAS